jgi:hypothetical protein
MIREGFGDIFRYLVKEPTFGSIPAFADIAGAKAKSPADSPTIPRIYSAFGQTPCGEEIVEMFVGGWDFYSVPNHGTSPLTELPH